MDLRGDISCLSALTSLRYLDLSALAILQRLVLGLGVFSRMLALKNLQGLDQAAKGVIVAQGREHAGLPANPLMKSAAGQGEPLSRGARLGL